jgi:hypothetical protein
MFAKFSPDESDASDTFAKKTSNRETLNRRVEDPKIQSDGSRYIVNAQFDWVYEESFLPLTVFAGALTVNRSPTGSSTPKAVKEMTLY